MYPYHHIQVQHPLRSSVKGNKNPNIQFKDFYNPLFLRDHPKYMRLELHIEFV